MSVNIYFKESVRRAAGFKSEPYLDNSGDRMNIAGLGLLNSNGRLYAMFNIDDDVPEIIVQYVEEISCYEHIPQMSVREAGIYRHESATCELVPDSTGGKNSREVYRLKISGKKMADIRAILHEVKVGKIRPEESYERPQQGPSRRELELDLNAFREVAQTYKEEADDLRRDLKIADITLDIYKGAVEGLHRTIRDKAYEIREKKQFGISWPFCLRKKVVDSLLMINSD